MFRIHWRLHGTIGPAVLKSTFVGSTTVPECYPQQHFNRSRGAHSLPPLFIPSFPAAFPFCSSLAPWLAPPSHRQFGWQAQEFGHIRRNRSGKVGRSKNIEFTVTSALPVQVGEVRTACEVQATASNALDQLSDDDGHDDDDNAFGSVSLPLFLCKSSCRRCCDCFI